MRLILARHGETQWNVDGLIQGANGHSLTDRGVGQARALAAALAGDVPFVLYTSPLARAVETSAIISEAAGLTAVRIEGLEEADAGELTGLSGHQMRERYPEFSALWDADPGTAQMPGGESLLQVQERAWKAVTALGTRHGEATVVAVTHHFTIHSIVCRILDVPLGSLSRLRVDLGSVTRLELSKGSEALVSLNETGHLRPGG